MNVSKKISFLGEYFSYHHLAAKAFFGDENTFDGKASFDKILTSVKEGESEFGILAVNNSIAGDIPGNFDRIVESGLTICGEIILQIELQLAANGYTSPEKLLKVVSHPMVWKETSIFFKKHPHIKFEPAISTATAVKLVSEYQDISIGAIGSKTAIDYFKLQVIASNIDDHLNNYTRFLIVTNQNVSNETTTLYNKSSLLLQTLKPNDKEIRLQPLNNENILLIRNLKNGNVYIETNTTEFSQINNLFNNLEGDAIQLKVLGRYPAGRTERGL